MQVEKLISIVETRAETIGFDEMERKLLAAAEAQDNLARAADASSVVQDKATRSLLSTAQQLDRMRSRIDPTFRAQQQYAQAVERLTQLHGRLGSSQDELARDLALAEQKYLGVAKAATAAAAAQANVGAGGVRMQAGPVDVDMPTRQIDETGRSVQYAAHEINNLRMQLFDMGTMLAMGSSPMMVLASQGTQIAQVLGGAGGASGAVGMLGAAFMSILSPVNLAIGALGLATFAATSFFADSESGADAANRELERQKSLIDDIKRAYGEAGEVLETFSQRSLLAMRFEAERGASDLPQRARGGIGDLLGQFPGFRSSPAFEPFREDFMRLLNEARQSASTGTTPDLPRFLEAIRRTAVNSADEDVKSLAEDILKKAADLELLAEDIRLRRGADLLTRIDPNRIALDARKGAGYERLNERLMMESRGIAPAMTDPTAPIPKPSPARDLTADLAGAAALQASYDALLATADRRLQQLQMEATAAGMTREQADALRFSHELLNEAVAKGIELSPQMRAELEARGRAMAAAAEQGRLAAEQQRRVEEAARQAAETAKRQAEETARFWENTLGGALKSLTRGGDPKEILLDIGFSIGDKLIDEGMSALFSGQTGGGIFAGLSELLTGKKSTASAAASVAQQMVGTMSVQAATVYVNGLAGLPGMTAPAGGGVPGGLAPVDRAPLSPLSAPGGRVGGIGSDSRFPLGMAPADLASPAGMYRYLRANGLGDLHAAALLGNMQQESTLDPASFNRDENAFGLLNWRLDRKTGLEAMAAARGLPATDIKTQLDFALAELRTTPSGQQFLASGDLVSANAALKGFIRYGDNSLGQRLGYSQQFAQQFGTGVGQPFAMPAAMPSAGAAGAFNIVGNGAIDPRLMQILQTTAAQWGGRVDLVSGLRPGDPRFHGRGLAGDVRLFDQAGNPLANYQNASTFRTYEQFAQMARQNQMAMFPELGDRFRWGGYFSGGRGRYGAMDLMHFDLGGGRVGMGGGSWEAGLTPQQLALWPGAQSVGMGQAAFAGMAGGVPLPAAAPGVDQANAALTALAQNASAAGDGLGGLGGVLNRVLPGLTQPGGAPPITLGPQMMQGVPSIPATATNPLQFAGVGPGAWSGMGAIGPIGDSFASGLDGALMGIVGMIGQAGGKFGPAFAGVLQMILSSMSGAGGGGGGLGGLLGALFGGLGGGGMTSIGGLYADGGPVRGPGGPRDDAIPAMLSNGEFVINAAAARRHGPLLEAINAGRSVSRYADGGPVGRRGYADFAATQIAARDEQTGRAGRPVQITQSFGAPSFTITGVSDPERVGEEVDRRMRSWMRETSKQERFRAAFDDGKWRQD